MEDVMPKTVMVGCDPDLKKFVAKLGKIARVKPKPTKR
jgi:hypothetical protein